MASTDLSARQLAVMKAVVEVTKTDAIDWTAIATKANIKTAKYARDSWTGVKNMLALAENGILGLSARQYDLVRAYVGLMQGTIDWAAVATKAKFKTSKYARDSWSGVKAKLAAGGDGEDGDQAGAAPAPKAKCKGGLKKRKADNTEDDAEVGEVKPAKKKKAAERKVKKEPLPAVSEGDMVSKVKSGEDGTEAEEDKPAEDTKKAAGRKIRRDTPVASEKSEVGEEQAGEVEAENGVGSVVDEAVGGGIAEGDGNCGSTDDPVEEDVSGQVAEAAVRTQAEESDKEINFFD